MIEGKAVVLPVGSAVTDSGLPDKLDKLRLAVFISHPIQHYAPLFRALDRLVDLHVFYYSNFGQEQHHVDPGFGVPVKWDIPLLKGYKFSYLPAVPWQSASYHGKARLNLGLLRALRQADWGGVLLFGYAAANQWIVWALAKVLGIPLLYLSDSELLHQRSWLKRLAKEPLVRLFLSQISAFLAVGDHNVAYARRYGVTESQIYRAVLPVDIERFQSVAKSPDLATRLAALRRQYEIPKGAKVVLFCGKLVPYKRPMDLVQALRLLSSSGQPVLGLFVGTGPLETAIRQQGGKPVRITGFVNQHEIPLYYALSDILVVPSEVDPHPLVVTEAASLGVPAIVSDHVGCVGPNDVLRDGETGLVYPCGDIERLAQAINTLIANDELRMRMGKRAQELAETQSPMAAARHIRDALAKVAAMEANGKRK